MSINIWGLRTDGFRRIPTEDNDRDFTPFLIILVLKMVKLI